MINYYWTQVGIKREKNEGKKMESVKRILIILAAGIILIACMNSIFRPVGAQADTLSAASADANTSCSSTSFETAISTSLNPVPGEVLVVATFTCQSRTPTGTPRYAYYRLTDGITDTSEFFKRYLSGTNDAGIGSLVYIFNNPLEGERTYTLQHKTDNSSRPIETIGTLVAVSLVSADGKNLDNDNIWVTTEFDTNSTDYLEVTGSATSAVTLPDSGDFYVAASLNSTSASGSAIGYWRLEYKKGSGDWTADEFGQEVERSMSATSDVGIVNLCAVLQNQSADDYYFRLASKSSVSGVTVRTNYVNLVAVALTSPDSPNPSFDTFKVSRTGAETSSSTLTGAVSEDNIKPSSDTDVFLQAQYDSTNDANNHLATYDLVVSLNKFNGRDQDRFFGLEPDYGSGSSVGLAEGLAANTTYTAILRHATDGGTLTTNAYLLGFALTSGTPLFVELSSFSVNYDYDAGSIRIEWKTAAEIDNAGFRLWRNENRDGQYICITDSIIPAEGSAAQGAEYSYLDTDLELNTEYFYKLEDIDTSGQNTFHTPTAENMKNIQDQGAEILNQATESKEDGGGDIIEEVKEKDDSGLCFIVALLKNMTRE